MPHKSGLRKPLLTYMRLGVETRDMSKTHQGNPIFTLRLPQEVHEQIREMSKFYGAANPRQFLREMVLAMLSGDPGQVAAFNKRLFAGFGEQLTLNLTQQAQEQAQQAAQQAQQSKKKPIKRTGKGKASTHGKRHV